MDRSIFKKNWKKNWAGGWSLLTCDYLGYQYTKQLKDVLGLSLEEVLFVCHDGIASCYFVEERKDEFGKKLAGMAQEHPAIINEWAQKLKDTSDAALSTVQRLSTEDVSSANMGIFIQSMYDYGVYHRIVKVVVDYLPADILNAYLPILSDARVYAEPVYEQTEKYMQYVAGRIEERTGRKPEHVLAMTKKQFETYLVIQEIPDDTTLEVQYHDAVLYVAHGEDMCAFGVDDTAIVERALVDQTTSNVLSGQIAFSGVARGRVRIILDPSNAGEFREGDILVTGMTRPEYLPFVKKSAAFVTDAGGVLSHAAITARELKKPCIIGTQIATKVLKNGDEIEVDATKGIIRILTRA